MIHRSQASQCIFKSNWWTVEVPSGWKAREDKNCVTLSNGPTNALQISAAAKGAVITDEELLEFGRDRCPNDQAPQRVATKYFAGVHAEYVQDGISFREWWLSSGGLMLHVTYNCDSGERDTQRNVIERIVQSLRPLDFRQETA